MRRIADESSGSSPPLSFQHVLAAQRDLIAGVNRDPLGDVKIRGRSTRSGLNQSPARTARDAHQSDRPTTHAPPALPLRLRRRRGAGYRPTALRSAARACWRRIGRIGTPSAARASHAVETDRGPSPVPAHLDSPHRALASASRACAPLAGAGLILYRAMRALLSLPLRIEFAGLVLCGAFVCRGGRRGPTPGTGPHHIRGPTHRQLADLQR